MTTTDLRGLKMTQPSHRQSYLGVFGVCLECVWSVFGVFLGSGREMFGKCSGSFWEVFGKCLGMLRSVWEHFISAAQPRKWSIFTKVPGGWCPNRISPRWLICRSTVFRSRNASFTGSMGGEGWATSIRTSHEFYVRAVTRPCFRTSLAQVPSGIIIQTLPQHTTALVSPTRRRASTKKPSRASEKR